MANKIKINEGDKVYISLQNNSDDKVLIFQGIAQSVSHTDGEIYIIAESRVVEHKEFNETYKDTKLEVVLKVLVPNLKYEASDFEQAQIICRGKKEVSLRRLLENKYYFTDLERNLIVRDKPSQGSSFIIDDCMYSTNNDGVTIFPIPQLEINDIVEYQGQKFIVKEIIYHYLNKAQMILGVIKYIEPEVFPQEKQQQEEEIPTSKPALEEYDCFENPEKLDELSESARMHIIDMAKEVKKEMDSTGEKFVKIYITSAFRTGKEQVDAMMNLLSIGVDLADYYGSSDVTKAYLRILQDRFDGKENYDFESIAKAYDESGKNYLTDRNGEKRAEVFKDIIDKYANDVQDDLDIVYKVLMDSIATKYKIPSKNNPSATYNEPLFMPSSHMIQIDGVASSQAMDIKRTNGGDDSIEDSAYKVYKRYKGSKHFDDRHYHLGK